MMLLGPQMGLRCSRALMITGMSMDENTAESDSVYRVITSGLILDLCEKTTYSSKEEPTTLSPH